MELIKARIHKSDVSLHLFRASIEITITLQVRKASCSWRHSGKTTLKAFCNENIKTAQLLVEEILS